MDERQMMISTICFLASTIVGMATYIVHLHAKHSKTVKELLMSMIESSMKTATVVENNNQLVRQVIEKI
jgi:hypothetical protein